MFKVGDRVRLKNQEDPQDNGHESVIADDRGDTWRWRFVLLDGPPSGDPAGYEPAELDLVRNDPQPTIGKDYHLGYAAGYTHNPRYAPLATGDQCRSADYRAGYLDGLKQRHAEEIETAESLFAA